MACRLFGAKPLSKPMLSYCQLGSQEQTSVKFESELYIFIQENAFENVCQNGGHIVQWPLLLTWFNFNPSMDK